jgi:fructose-specific phosphotransferase system IIC component
MSEKDLGFEIESGKDQGEKRVFKGLFSNPMKHLGTGISYMLPFILLGGIISALGQFAQISDSAIWAWCTTIGELGLKFFVPIFGAFVAYSIANKAAIAPAFIASYLANESGSGYLGALVAGFLVGYLIEILKRAVRPKKMLQIIWDYLVPIVVGLGVSLLIVFLLNGPIAKFVDSMAASLVNISSEAGGVIGGIFGALSGVDYGGPISKVGMIVMFAGFEQGLETFVGIGVVIAAMPPLGLMMAAWFAPKLFTKEERNYSKTTWPIVLIGGFTELALPLVAGDILRCTIASFIGSVVGGALAGIVGLSQSVPALGLPSWFFVNSIPLNALCLLVGAGVTCGVVILLKKYWKRKNFDPELA